MVHACPQSQDYARGCRAGTPAAPATRKGIGPFGAVGATSIFLGKAVEPAHTRNLPKSLLAGFADERTCTADADGQAGKHEAAPPTAGRCPRARESASLALEVWA